MDASRVLDRYLGPFLVPTIMAINLFRQYKSNQVDLLYATVTFGSILGSLCGLIQHYISTHFGCRTRKTLFVAALMNAEVITAMIGFNFIRLNMKPSIYRLPSAARDRAAFFEYHFFADMIPGGIIFANIQLSSLLTNQLICRAKRKFTLGEASIIAQLASAASLVFNLTLYSKFFDAGPFAVYLTTDIVLNIGFIVFAVVLLPDILLAPRIGGLARYGLMGACVGLSYMIVQDLIAVTSNLDPVTWLVAHIFATHQKISLFSLWISTLAACISFSTSWTKMVGQTNSLVRKVFHLAIGVVFISGYNQDIEFTRFAAGGILIVMILIEAIRAWQLKPLGKPLENVCRSLRGKWDNRYLTVSHIYLLVGTFLPLWLLPTQPGFTSKLALSCGLLSVGVGDTAAAIVGTFFGKTKISEKSGKTVEGLVGNVLAMILFQLIWVGYSDFVQEFSFVLVAILTASLELITETCDNLVLPLVMMLLIEIF